MRVLTFLSMLIIFNQLGNAQWTPDFSVNGKGINTVSPSNPCNGSDPTPCPTYDVSGMNWFLTGVSIDPFGFTQGADMPPQPDYAKVTSGGFETQDPDGDICITSPILNITGLGTVTSNFSVIRLPGIGSYASADDAVYSSYSINGGAFVNSSLFTGAAGSTSTWSQTFSGTTVVIKLCMDANSIEEEYRVTVMNTSAGAPLPVSWAGFFISKTEKGHSRLSWQTAEEIDNDFFVVERSMDGINFEEIGKISGEGNHIEKKNYSYIDENTKAGNQYYYRIKQVDFGGNSDYSVVLSIKIEALKLAVNVSPNPITDFASIEFNEALQSDQFIQIINMNGSVVKTIKVNVGEFSKSLDMSDLSNGVYLIKSLGTEQIHQLITKSSGY